MLWVLTLSFGSGLLSLKASGQTASENKQRVSLAAVDYGDELSYFTDAGRALDVLAPGEDVIAPAFINGTATYTAVSGTSSAHAFTPS